MKYQGNELEIFKDATRWKSYWSSFIPPTSNGTGLEVGAGIGGNIPSLLLKNAKLVLLEPDPFFCESFLNLYAQKLENISVLVGTVSNLDQSKRYDHIYYIDVLEHIYDDAQEIQLALQLLKPSGSIFFLVPSHSFLYSEFDKSVGHYRRYSKRSFKLLLNCESKIVQLKYLDSIGLIAALMSKIIWHAQIITPKKIHIWNKYLVPISVVIDKALRFNLGKSLFVEITNSDIKNLEQKE